MLLIDWFLQGHEHRNDYLRCAMMRRHLAGEVDLRVRRIQESIAYGFSSRPEGADFRHTSIFCVTNGRSRLRVGIDNEDGLIHLSPLINDVDVYFCCPYNRRFHVDRQFIEPYGWQTEEDVRWHRQQADKVLDRFGPCAISEDSSARTNDFRHGRSWPKQPKRRQAGAETAQHIA